jgi:hypothetical protein
VAGAESSKPRRVEPGLLRLSPGHPFKGCSRLLPRDRDHPLAAIRLRASAKVGNSRRAAAHHVLADILVGGKDPFIEVGR